MEKKIHYATVKLVSPLTSAADELSGKGMAAVSVKSRRLKNHQAIAP
jgi:hypothetical protein